MNSMGSSGTFHRYSVRCSFLVTPTRRGRSPKLWIVCTFRPPWAPRLEGTYPRLIHRVSSTLSDPPPCLRARCPTSRWVRHTHEQLVWCFVLSKRWTYMEKNTRHFLYESFGSFFQFHKSSNIFPMKWPTFPRKYCTVSHICIPILICCTWVRVTETLSSHKQRIVTAGKYVCLFGRVVLNRILMREPTLRERNFLFFPVIFTSRKWEQPSAKEAVAGLSRGWAITEDIAAVRLMHINPACSETSLTSS